MPGSIQMHPALPGPILSLPRFLFEQEAKIWRHRSDATPTRHLHLLRGGYLRILTTMAGTLARHHLDRQADQVMRSVGAAERLHVRAELGMRLAHRRVIAFLLHRFLLFLRHRHEGSFELCHRLHGLHAGVGEERRHVIGFVESAGKCDAADHGKSKRSEADVLDVHDVVPSLLSRAPKRRSSPQFGTSTVDVSRRRSMKRPINRL
jgi:hypothetical protein